MVLGESGWKGVTWQQRKEEDEMNVVELSDVQDEWKKRNRVKLVMKKKKEKKKDEDQGVQPV